MHLNIIKTFTSETMMCSNRMRRENHGPSFLTGKCFAPTGAHHIPAKRKCLVRHQSTLSQRQSAELLVGLSRTDRAVPDLVPSSNFSFHSNMIALVLEQALCFIPSRQKHHRRPTHNIQPPFQETSCATTTANLLQDESQATIQIPLK